jgi:dTDP-glucose 4,6-dehydratase
MNILVTGGLGAVGRPLVKELRRLGHEVWICDRGHHRDPNYFRCDMGEYRQVEQLFRGVTYDMVYHLAGEFGRRNGEDFYESLWKTNAIGTKNLLHFQQELGFKMVFTSSSEIYGDYSDVMSEDIPLTVPIRQLNDYAISKWVNELQILNSADRYGTETVRLRLFNLYGPGEQYSDYRSVVCLFVYRALHDEPYIVYTQHHRTFCYIDDAVQTIAGITQRFKAGEAYNIGSNEYVSMRQLSDMVLSRAGKSDSKVEYIEVEPHNTMLKKGSTEKAQRDLGHQNRVDLEHGIDQTIAWQKEVYRH